MEEFVFLFLISGEIMKLVLVHILRISSPEKNSLVEVLYKCCVACGSVLLES